MNPVLLIVSAVLAACLYLVGLALDLFWLKLLTKPWLVVALAAAVWKHAGSGAGRRIAWGLLAGAILFGFSDMLIGIHRFAQPLPGAAFAIILSYWAGQTLFAATAIRREKLAA